MDFPASRKTAALADTLIAEALADPGCVEIGHLDDLRWGVGLSTQPFPAADAPLPGAMELGSDSVFLITGAAGSIVSAIIADLARPRAARSTCWTWPPPRTRTTPSCSAT